MSDKDTLNKMLAEDSRDYISTESEWTFDLIQTYDREIGKIAEGYELDTYPNQIEIISPSNVSIFALNFSI